MYMNECNFVFVCCVDVLIIFYCSVAFPGKYDFKVECEKVIKTVAFVVFAYFLYLTLLLRIMYIHLTKRYIIVE